MAGDDTFPYHVFIVRCWLERGEETAVWRFTIQGIADDRSQLLDNLVDVTQVIEQKLQQKTG